MYGRRPSTVSISTRSVRVDAVALSAGSSIHAVRSMRGGGMGEKGTEISAVARSGPSVAVTSSTMTSPGRAELPGRMMIASHSSRTVAEHDGEGMNVTDGPDFTRQRWVANGRLATASRASTWYSVTYSAFRSEIETRSGGAATPRGKVFTCLAPAWSVAVISTVTSSAPAGHVRTARRSVDESTVSALANGPCGPRTRQPTVTVSPGSGSSTVVSSRTRVPAAGVASGSARSESKAMIRGGRLSGRSR